eukprot:1159111-Pelagomonas_calceolata.AAC.4
MSTLCHSTLAGRLAKCKVALPANPPKQATGSWHPHTKVVYKFPQLDVFHASEQCKHRLQRLVASAYRGGV